MTSKMASFGGMSFEADVIDWDHNLLDADLGVPVEHVPPNRDASPVVL